jgi:glutaredoxin
MRTPDSLTVVVAAVLAAFAAPLAAQYKWVGPGGTVNYSDLPPPPGYTAVALGQPLPARAAESDGVPASLRAAVSKHPVTLFTTSDCAPCQQARAYLSGRGVPFAERTVKSTADADAFRRLGFADNSFPSVSIGRQRSVGFEAGEWGRLLESAGYPANASLPPSYRQSPARALAAPARRPAAAENDAGGAMTAEARYDGSAEASDGSPREVAARQRITPRAAAAAPQAAGGARPASSVRF